MKLQKANWMVIITLAGWYALYLPVRQVVAYEYHRRAAVCTFVVALCVEIWFTQDFFRTLFDKFF